MRTITLFCFLITLSGCEISSATNTGNEAEASEAQTASPINPETVGEYLCTVAEKASIESIHLEGSGPPSAVAERNLTTRFRIDISKVQIGGQQRLRLDELPFDGANRDSIEWHTANSVLHSSYLGDGESFHTAQKDTEGFFVLGPTVHSSADGDLSFYHSGFEWAGGEDTRLSVRWGRCKRT